MHIEKPKLKDVKVPDVKKEVIVVKLRSSELICTDLRRYNKDKGWPLAHEAADKIDALEVEKENLQSNYNKLLAEFHKTRLL